MVGRCEDTSHFSVTELVDMPAMISWWQSEQLCFSIIAGHDHFTGAFAHGGMGVPRKIAPWLFPEVMLELGPSLRSAPQPTFSYHGTYQEPG